MGRLVPTDFANLPLLEFFSPALAPRPLGKPATDFLPISPADKDLLPNLGVTKLAGEVAVLLLSKEDEEATRAFALFAKEENFATARAEKRVPENDEALGLKNSQVNLEWRDLCRDKNFQRNNH